MSSLAKHVIQQPKPFRHVLVAVIAVIMTLAIQWFFQQQKSIQTSIHTSEQIQQLHNEKEELEASNTQKQNILKQHYDQKIDLEHATTLQLQMQLAKLQEQVLTLNKELLFYQEITQGSSSSKLQFRELELRRDNSQANLIRYRMVVTQGQKINKPITGTINLLVDSDNNGTPKQYALESQALNLRHVQVIEGQIEIEASATPLTLTAELVQNKKITLSRTFDWQLTSDN